eukprot:1176313-Prorocentrum_minimum.AAC.4
MLPRLTAALASTRAPGALAAGAPAKAKKGALKIATGVEETVKKVTGNSKGRVADAVNRRFEHFGEEVKDAAEIKRGADVEQQKNDISEDITLQVQLAIRPKTNPKQISQRSLTLKSPYRILSRASVAPSVLGNMRVTTRMIR